MLYKELSTVPRTLEHSKPSRHVNSYGDDDDACITESTERLIKNS